MAWRAWGLRAVLGAALFTAVLGAGELYVRKSRPWLADNELKINAARPSGRGWRLEPGLDLEVRVEGAGVRLRANSKGYRGREHSPQPQPGYLRAVVLGDSFTCGLWARTEERTFVAVAETALADRKVELLNLGVGGYGFEECLAALEEDGLALDPRLVVLCAYNGNDFRESYLGAGSRRVVRGVLVDDLATLARKLPDTPFQEPWLPLAARPWYDPEHLVLWRWLRQARQRAAPPPAAKPSSAFPLTQSFSSPSIWSLTEPPPAVPRAVEATLALARRIGASAEARGAKFMIVALPYRLQVLTESMTGAGYDLGLPQAHLERLCAERNWPYLDVLPAMRAAAASGARLFVQGDIHWTDEGHRVVGTALAGFLEEKLGPWLGSAVR